ncbi:hypothetical protein H2203_006063 [Taxawa tesnikishii (nom. ined.)]|nr:hypothetical protein H2203_006063 [Dothideales sp. JES 119]
MAPSDKPLLTTRQSSTLHYQTFPTAPPTSRGKPPTSSSPTGDTTHRSLSRQDSQTSGGPHESPLPKGQLAILAVIALAEQTALNSISPYLPDMASTFPEVKEGQVGLYVGLIASSFALAQFATNFFWGWLSDRIGRKPVVLTGTALTAACFVAFGFCRTLWQAVIVQVCMGLVNGNQGVIKIPWKHGKSNPYPYLAPNLLSAALLLIDMVATMMFLEESLEEVKDLPLSVHAFQKTQEEQQYQGLDQDGAAAEQDEDEDDEDDDDSDSASSAAGLGSRLFPSSNTEGLSSKTVFTRDTILLLATFLIFQLSNISYNSLYPIFAQANPPTGRDLSPEEIGLSLGFAGVVTIIFQVGIFGKLRERIGNKIAYRVGFAGFVGAFLLMPWAGYKDGGSGMGQETQMGKVLLWVELGAILILKTIAAVGCLTSALLLITNSAPNHSVLGTLNGLAQTLSAAGRAIGPFISGSLFSAATGIQPKGEALPFGIFGGISFLGFLLSFGIRGADLEAEGWNEDRDGDEETGSEDEEAGSSASPPARPR